MNSTQDQPNGDGGSLCEYFCKMGAKCVHSNLGHHLHLCQTCGTLVVQSGAAIACEKRCFLVSLTIRFRNEQASETNDYNPMVTKFCSKCWGRGYQFSPPVGGDTWIAEKCAECDCKGTITGRQYGNSDFVDLVVDEAGWTQCPGCGFRFKASNPNSMIAYRHNRCGQKIRFLPATPGYVGG